MKSIMSSKKTQTIKLTTSVTGVTSGNGFQFAASSAPYWNISTILNASASFSDMLADYTLFRITGVKADINRIISDSNIPSIYPTGVLPPFFLLFQPNFTSVGGLTPLNQSSAAFQVDPTITEKQRVAFNFEPIFSQNSSSTYLQNANHFYGMWNAVTGTSSISNMPGQLSMIPVDNVSTATTNTPLYSLTVYVDVEFAGDFA